MEDTLTDCLVRVKEDLNNLNRIRDYLETNTETGHCSITWRTIEAFSSILGVCSSQHTPQTDALDILLDSFHHLARNNTDPSVWNDFGFELGIICLKVLSAIERCEIFEVLFCKLLTIINVICQHNTKVWKAGARQILNVFINKKFSLFYFERVIKTYLCIIRNVESVALLNFSLQNLHLLRTLSKLVQKVGDFEVQSDIMELVFLHLTNKTQIMTDFFGAAENNLLKSLKFVDFQSDCRTYLNTLNRPRGGFERKVYSVCCLVLYLGGCFVEPPVGTNSLWMDANKDTERLSIRCADFESKGDRVIYILFSDILHVQLSTEKTEGNQCLTIQTKSLAGLQFDVKNEDICLITENGEALFHFISFLNEKIKSKRKIERKMSRTRDSLLIDRSRTDRKENVEGNAIPNLENHEVEQILPDICNLFERAQHPTNTGTERQIKTSHSTGILSKATKSPPESQNVTLGSQELSPNSFVESLNKHIGRDSPEIPCTFEDSVETIEFVQRSVPGGGHKLFRNTNEVFDGLKAEEPNNLNSIFDEEKENKPVIEKVKPRLKTYEGKRKKTKHQDNFPIRMVLRERKNLKPELSNTQSQDYFQHSMNTLKKRKPSLPKLKRNTKAKIKKPEVQKGNFENEEATNTSNCRPSFNKYPKPNKHESILDKKITEKDKMEKIKGRRQEKHAKSEQSKLGGQEVQSVSREKQRIPRTESATENKHKPDITQERKPPKQQELQLEKKPSLLDPNGYTYRRWCEPTTSERGNFWLRKLNAMQKPKSDSGNVFNFSEDSDSASAKAKRKKRRIVHSKRKYQTKEAEQTSLKQVKEILRRTSPKGKQKVTPEKTMVSKIHRLEVLPKSPEPFPSQVSIRDRCCDGELQQVDQVSKHETSLGTPHKNRADEINDESDSFDEEKDEDPPARIKKRERSIEETSLNKAHIKKKSKITLSPRNLLSVLQHRLLKKKEQNKHQTDEIIQTVNKALNHLFNHLQRKEVQKMGSYLKAAEETVATVAADVESLKLRAKRMQRAMLYFQAGCSVSDLCESLEDRFSGVRSAFRDFEKKKDVSRMISRVNERLMGLIKSEIDKSIEREFTSKRNKFLKCASIFSFKF